MWDRNIKNDTISSVMVPQGYTVKLYEADGFQGQSITLDGPLWNSNNNMMMSC